MLKNEIYQVGSIANQITSTRENPQRYRVYLIGGVSPALNCAQGGGLNPYVIVEIDNDSLCRINRRKTD